MTFGLIVGNRGFFPDHLAKSGREEMMRGAGEGRAYDVVALTPEEIEVRRGGDARRSAALRGSVSTSIADEIDGIIVTLPNFGDERAIADTLRMAGSEGAGADAGHARHARRR